MSFPGKSDPLEALASMMPNAWPLFFSRRKLLPIQLAAMPMIVRGQSVLLCGPTASGKTEAAVAPLFQRHYSFRRAHLSVVYVAPTKALVNDLQNRLEDYLGREVMGIVCRYTGDHHQFNSPEGAFILLSTPEGLDSLQLMQPEKLSGVRAVVIDEIHLMHGRARGQQLRCVIDRIRRNCSEPCSPKDNFQVIGMSATLSDMEEVARLWLGDQAFIVKAGDPREIEMHLLGASDNGTTDSASKAIQIADWVVQNKPRKVLVFANSRNSAHQLAVELNRRLAGTRWPVHMHIGILSRSEREYVENAMKQDSHGICVATSTLEIGIDIGDIEVVALAEPPYSINAFLQRIGRGNRRTGKCIVLAIHQGEREKELFLALLYCAREGILDDLHEFDRPSVYFQQILSLIWRESRSGRAVSRRTVEKKLGGGQYNYVLEDMLYTGALKELDGELILSDELMDEGDARRIHSVLIGSSGMSLTDSLSGEIVANSLDGQTSEGYFLSRGKLKYLEAAPSGEFYLRNRANMHDALLARLPAARGKRGLSRCLVWAIAGIRGVNPRRWTFHNNCLTTWGGSEYNRLLKLLFEIESIAEKITVDDERIVAQKWNMVPGPQRVREMAPKVQTSVRKSAVWFREPTRYLKLLSQELQDTEAAASVPFQNFMGWLAECEGEMPAD